MTTESSINTCV